MASFRVIKLTKTVVAPALPQRKRWLPQSNLDLLFHDKVDMGVCFCYRKPLGTGYSFGSIVNTLKNALSQALVPYYALTGEMVTNAAGDRQLLCNNRGVDFVEAYADVELRDLNLYEPDESIQGKLLPVLKDGVLSAQATQLSCGGVVVGCTFDHRVADAYSGNMFWKSWAEMAQSMPLSNLPSYQQSLLSPRQPGSYDSSVTDTYIPISKLQQFRYEKESNITKPPPLVSRIYSVPADQIHRLQQLANHENPNSLILKRTKLEAFSAFLWKLIASKTNTMDNDFRLGLAIDRRTRIADTEMRNYFGKVVSYSFGKKKCRELDEMPLCSIANEIHQFLDTGVSKEHFLGLIDFVEANHPTAATMYAVKVSKEEPAILVSSSRDFPVGREMDFGWGAPVFGSYICPPGIPCGYVLPLPCPAKDGGWLVYMCLSEHQIEVIEDAAPHIFKPFCLE